MRRILQQQGASVLNDLGYTPDVNGNRTTITEQLAGTTLTTQYQYDPLQPGFRDRGPGFRPHCCALNSAASPTPTPYTPNPALGAR